MQNFSFLAGLEVTGNFVLVGGGFQVTTTMCNLNPRVAFSWVELGLGFDNRHFQLYDVARMDWIAPIDFWLNSILFLVYDENMSMPSQIKINSKTWAMKRSRQPQNEYYTQHKDKL